MCPGDLIGFDLLHHRQVGISQVFHGNTLYLCFLFKSKGDRFRKLVSVRRCFFYKRIFSRSKFFDPVRRVAGRP